MPFLVLASTPLKAEPGNRETIEEGGLLHSHPQAPGVRGALPAPTMEAKLLAVPLLLRPALSCPVLPLWPLPTSSHPPPRFAAAQLGAERQWLALLLPHCEQTPQRLPALAQRRLQHTPCRVQHFCKTTDSCHTRRHTCGANAGTADALHPPSNQHCIGLETRPGENPSWPVCQPPWSPFPMVSTHSRQQPSMRHTAHHLREQTPSWEPPGLGSANLAKAQVAGPGLSTRSRRPG